MPVVADTETDAVGSAVAPSPASRNVYARRYPDEDIRNEFDLAAATVPGYVLEKVGWTTQRGRLRYDLAVLARLIYLHYRLGDLIDPIEYEQGFSISQGISEFVSSLRSIARSLYARCFFCRSALDASRSPDKDIANELDGVPSFEQFYDRIKADFARRIRCMNENSPVQCDVIVSDGNGGYRPAEWVRDLGSAATKEHLREWETDATESGRQVKSRKFFGKRLTLWGTALMQTRVEDEETGRIWSPLHWAEPDAPLPMVQTSFEPPGESQSETPDVGSQVAAARHLTRLTTRRHGLHRAFTKGVYWYADNQRGWGVCNWHGWQGKKARRKAAHERRSRHVSVGAFRPGEAKPDSDELNAKRACAMPYIVFDIDASGPKRSLEYVDLLLARLSRLGADRSQIVVSYTGGKGFHVRVPAGMVGNPIYRTPNDARRIVRRFMDMVAGDREGADGSLSDVIDGAKASPATLIRAVGSVHEKTGRHCVAFTGEEIGETPLWKVKAYSESGYSPPPQGLPDPSEAALAPQLASALWLAAEEHTDALRAAGEQQENRGIIARIEEGVAKGEEFAPGYAGRNLAALLLSLNYVQRFGKSEAWGKVQAWNAALPQPLGTAAGDDKNELWHQFDRAVRKAEEQAAAES